MSKKLHLVDIVPVTAPGILSEQMITDMTKYLMPETEVEHLQIEKGPITIECEYDEVFASPEVVKLAEKINKEKDIDGIFINCFGDPGVRPAREAIKKPIYGGFEPAILLALGLGDKVGIVTVLKNVMPMLQSSITKSGLENRVVSLRSLDIPVLQLEDHDLLMKHLYGECKKAIEEDGVNVLVMGCTGIVGIDDEMKERLLADGYDVPVLEAGQCAMTLLELYARMGLYPSRTTYMTPPEKG